MKKVREVIMRISDTTTEYSRLNPLLNNRANVQITSFNNLERVLVGLGLHNCSNLHQDSYRNINQ